MSSNETSPWEEVSADQAAQNTPERDDPDPWQIDGADPWSNYDPRFMDVPQPNFGEQDYGSPYSAPYSQAATSSRLNPNARPFSGPVTHGGTGDYQGRGKPHDVPPVWDGRDPDRQLEPYLKLLKAWLITTQVQKEQRGIVIMHYSQGSLRELIDALDIDVLTDILARRFMILSN